MAEESNAFYVVRKGDIISIYKSFSDCQAQVSSSVCDPPVSVYKSYGLLKETEEYLASRGVKNPLYSIHASDMKEDLFGTLLTCPFQQPDGLADVLPKKMSSLKRTKDMVLLIFYQLLCLCYCDMQCCELKIFDVTVDNDMLLCKFSQ
ncbi:hypothetical protein BHE74_00057646 [Ensete ventricosum]|nr:hypothetical protein GW17_00029722 [Ensete ventricosum]RWW37268.1 hypothetical protein BHE74_00057646 [Ensete ventricosum]RZS27758.1 hypothetical protein BHM03_00061273 [Ensete ventricosum]